MRKLIILLAALVFNISQAEAIVQHWGYCTQFETMHSCQQSYTNNYEYKVYCSCSGEAPKTTIKIRRDPDTGNICHPRHPWEC